MNDQYFSQESLVYLNIEPEYQYFAVEDEEVALSDE